MYENSPIETLIIPISKSSATGVIASIPSGEDPQFTLSGMGIISKVAQPALILGVHVIRTTVWNTAATVKIGTESNDDYLSGEETVALNTAKPSGEAAAITSYRDPKYVADLTAVRATFSQASATAGAGHILIEYRRL